ncbi:MFS transporter [Nocardioidaceae bacterium SCSIO 66511]|nr:MFS transporter [Nocardioidaceae bacterium SCSIO 66511]
MTTTSTAIGPARTRRGWTLAIVCTAIFMLLLDVTVVAVALGDMQQSLDASLSDLQWVVDAYALSLACLLLTSATIGDRIGRRRVFLAGMVVFTVGSLACALAGNALVLDLTRALQGIGGAMLFGTAIPIIGDTFREPKARATAIGIFGATLGAATAIGPLVGGLLVDTAGWRWIFLVNVPVGVLALAAGARILPESRADNPRRADWPGTLLLTTTLLTLLLGLIRGQAEGWTSAPIIALFAGSVISCIAFLACEVRTAEPMLDLSLFRSRSYAGVSLAAFAVSATVIASTTYLGLYFVNTFAYDPFDAGLRFLAFTVASFVAAPLTARLVDRVRAVWTVSGGLALVAIGMAWMAQVDGSSEWTVFVPGFIVAGAGAGVLSACLTQAALDAVEPARAGMATGVVSTMRQVGVAAGVAVLGVLFHSSGVDATAEALSGSGVPADSTHRLGEAVGSGAGVSVLEQVPAAYRDGVAVAVRDASATAMSDILWWGAIGAGVTMLVVAALMITRRPAGSA